MKENILAIKSFNFAVRIVNLYKIILKRKCPVNLAIQILKAGTSIGSNIEEAIGSQSDREFLTKLSISFKESRETIYWIRLLDKTNYITRSESKSMIENCEEFLKIITSTRKKLLQRL